MVAWLCATVFPVIAQDDAAATAEPLPTPNVRYPRELVTDLGTVVIHVPQINSWIDFDTVEGATALEITPADSGQTTLASLEFKADAEVDIVDRVVTFSNISADNIKLSNPDADYEHLAAVVRSAFVERQKEIPLDVVLRLLPDDLPVRTEPIVKFDPPKIFVSTAPAILVLIDGKPVMGAIDGTNLEFVINTNWDLFFHTETEYWYLRNQGGWLRSDAIGGTWEPVSTLPQDFGNLPRDGNWSEVLDAIPPGGDAAAIVFTSQRPAEMILIAGEPEVEAIPTTALNFVRNTSSDLFQSDDYYYYLVSGRWFQSKSLTGDWATVESLPNDFKLIPTDHEKARVRASVPGTEEAWLAVMEAQIPRKADVSRDAGTNIQISYAGEPQWAPIAGTSRQRAANTSYQVILSEKKYYLCYNAIWFVSNSPNGPWDVTDYIPAEIYQIPPSDPAYNATYVRVYESDEDTVTSGYTSGYEGSYVTTSMTVVYGSGWYYPPYYYGYYGYPAYYWYPRTYGYGASYNPTTGTYGRTAVAYGPYGGAGATSRYNPETGAYARGNAVWDHDEMAASGYGYNPSTDTSFATNRYYDYDDQEGWAESVVTRGDEWLKAETEIRGDTRSTDFETSRGTTGTSTRTWDDGEMTGSGYAERDGKSVTTESSITEDGARVGFETSEGATGEVSRDRGDDTRDVSIEKDGQSLTGETQRTPEGVRTDWETSGGGSGTTVRGGGESATIAQSGEGDLYVGKDGNVYKRDESGWSQNNNGNWESAEREAQGRREEGQSQSFDRSTASTSARDRAGSSSNSRDTYSHSSYGTSNQSYLDRQHTARSQGYSSYNNYQRQRSSSGSYGGRSRGRSGGRRRR